ncbi:MAG: class I SAM-dependent methyltransferase, partial [Lachnospiraceae bacterium]|nr:class I SAM-dependent methyltransferase [Lachnospiraceae bacterium]
MNSWKKIWNGKTADSEILLNGDKRAILLELKRSNGFDVAEGMSFEAFCAQYEEIKKNLQKYNPIKSVYEVGCGSGANLYLFESENVFSGGLDFSSSLVQLAKQVLSTQDILCAEAIDLPIEKKYDAVFSNSVFSYFENEEYAERVLEKMLDKANYVIGLIDI